MAAAAAWDPGSFDFFHDLTAILELHRTAGPITAIANRWWLVTGHREVKALLGDRRLCAKVSRPQPSHREQGSEVGRGIRPSSAFVHHQAPEDHARLRRILAPSFSTARVEALQERIQRLTDERLAAVDQRAEVDMIADIAQPIALAVVSDLLGVNEESRALWGALARDLEFEFFATRPIDVARGQLAMSALAPRIEELISGWRSAPPAQDNLLWALERARSRGELSEADVIANGAMLLFVGHITTQHLIGNGVRTLLTHRQQWRRLCEHPELIETAVEELLRFESPVPVTPRTALTEIQVADERIGAGDSVILALICANHDPAVFSKPERLEIGRTPNPHLGFGYGAHHCVGAALGRLEAEIVIGTLAARMPHIRLASDEPDWEPPNVFRGLRSLPVLL